MKRLRGPESTELGARGAALLAATALGHFPTVSAASQAMTAGGERYTPHDDAAKCWTGPRRRFMDYRDRLLG